MINLFVFLISVAFGYIVYNNLQKNKWLWFFLTVSGVNFAVGVLFGIAESLYIGLIIGAITVVPKLLVFLYEYYRHLQSRIK